MKRLAGRQTRFVNRQESRTGILREGRYKSIPIQTDTYLLACLPYVELNPVRARMVESPESYKWSRYRQHTGMADEFSWLDNDPCYVGLGTSESDRAAQYRRASRAIA